jgi:hypothetical protein
MYSSGNPNYQYANQPYGTPTKSPPPLQHPIPQHPIPDFQQTATSPNMGHQYQYNQTMPQQPLQQKHNPMMQQPYNPNAYTPQPQQQNNLYTQFGFNDPAAQMGMQFAGSAMAQGSAYVEKNVSQHFFLLYLYFSIKLF